MLIIVGVGALVVLAAYGGYKYSQYLNEKKAHEKVSKFNRNTEEEIDKYLAKMEKGKFGRANNIPNKP